MDTFQSHRVCEISIYCVQKDVIKHLKQTTLFRLYFSSNMGSVKLSKPVETNDIIFLPNIMLTSFYFTVEEQISVVITHI